MNRDPASLWKPTPNFYRSHVVLCIGKRYDEGVDVLGCTVDIGPIVIRCVLDILDTIDVFPKGITEIVDVRDVVIGHIR
ncbi:hypothetical protein N7474_007865 [Penicillium riverlandense]|uniref:uncharacterized protein n=1 Tax=Penicillium riverlandense TaxID=1903569 RepID=UPI0025474E98|nr:uncharacterized protein N7474_007865 [Penicillium riverlandense]KAJ5811564.1 hypothetical protein N7474_007865 [Penicillium riverlandense]